MASESDFGEVSIVASGAMSRDDYVFNVCLLGKYGVGKTNLLLRYCYNIDERVPTTCRQSFDNAWLKVDCAKVRLRMWETWSTERFMTVPNSYIRGQNGFVLVYDITDRDSFEQIPDWICRVNELAPRAFCVLAGNKCDLGDKRVVTEEEGAAMARQYGMPFIEISVKKLENVEEVFVLLARGMIAKAEEPVPEEQTPPDPPQPNTNSWRSVIHWCW